MKPALEIIQKEPICMFASEIKFSERKQPKTHGAVEVIFADKPTSHSADAFTNEEDINAVVKYLLNDKQYGIAALFVFGINTGYRCGDMIAFRVKDFYDNGKFRNVLHIIEDKTSKVRTVYLNEAVKTAVEYAIKANNLTENNYIFRGKGNRKAYIKGFKYSKKGEIYDVDTCGERYDENGIEREITPMGVGSITRLLKEITEKLDINGHYSSHCMRKTFKEFVSQGYIDNRNVAVACYALGHSDARTTVKHYMGIDPEWFHKKCMEINLGITPYLEIIKPFI